MKMGTHEAMEMHEILSESICMIDHYAMYLSQCRDPELRRILERQQRHMFDSYNTKVNVMQGQGIDVSRAPRLTMGAPGMTMGAASGMGIEHQPDYGMQQTSPVTPRPEAGRLDDRTIAKGALLFHKCGAVCATNAALECANPQLRNLLASSARSCMEMAYEIFQYMNHKGWYQVPIMPEHTLNQMQQTYQPMLGH